MTKTGRVRLLLHDAFRYYLNHAPRHTGKRYVNWLVFQVFGHEWRTVIDMGQKMHVSLDDSVEAKIFRRIYEPKVTNIFVSLLKQGITVFDIGAHCGYYTLLAANRVGPFGQVHSFEPIPYVFQRLSRNIQANEFSNVILNNTALWQSEGQIRLYLPIRRNSGASSIVRNKQTGQQSTLVDAASIDSYVADRNVSNVDLIKIDTEGSELFILKGGLNTLRTMAPDIICEVNEVLFPSAGYSSNDLFSFVECLGYRVAYIETPWKGVSYAYISKTRNYGLPLWEEAQQFSMEKRP